MTATIFLHVPKTGGTTLARILNQNYSRRETFSIFQDGTLNDFKRLSEERRSQIQLLRGHTGYGAHRYLPQGGRYFTVLRDPIKRTISNFRHIQREKDHYFHALIAEQHMSLADFLNSGADPLMDNAHTRLLGGLEHGRELKFGECTREVLEEAKRNLTEHLAAFGLTERFDETLLLLQKNFGWKNIYYAPQLVDKVGKQSLSAIDLQAAQAANTFDIELYQYAVDLFNERIQSQGESFSREVSEFQVRNRRRRWWYQFYWGFVLQYSIRGTLKKVLRRK